MISKELKDEILALIEGGTHKCDFGCDNNCPCDGMLHASVVEGLIIMVSGADEINTEL